MGEVRYWLIAIFCLVTILTTLSLGTGCQQQKYVVQRADFTATPTSGDAPLMVQFTDQSIGNISGWLWLFGDGQTSTEQNPSHTYTGDGVYNVCLVVIKPDNSHETVTKEDYISVGNPAPPWTLTMHEALYWDYDILPDSEFVTLDIAGEGILYWTGFRVKDRDEVDWGVTQNYEHRIYVDGEECYDVLDSVKEIWEFQQFEVSRTDSLYPVIYYKGRDLTAQTFWRMEIPFHKVLGVVSMNKHPEGTLSVGMCYATYSLVGSGVPGLGGGRRGEEWSIEKVSDKLGFPAAEKLKTILEKEFSKKVFSVGIITRSHKDDPEAYSLLWVDAPEIERDEIRNFLVWEEFIELTYELTVIDFTANPTSGSAPLTVQFTNQSIGDVSGWKWSFGDGNTSTEQNPSHTYTTESNYTVSLEALSEIYGKKITVKDNYIHVGG